MVTAILFYEHVASNWGDLAINAGAVELLRRAEADVEHSTIVRMRPSDAFARLASLSATGLAVRDLQIANVPKGGAEEFHRLADALENPRRFAEEVGILDHDVVLLNAGEHMFEAPHSENLTDLVWRLLPAIVAVELGKPVVLLPSTLGPFLTPLGNEIGLFLSNSLTALAFRDAESQRLIGGSNRARPLLLDPGFFAAGEPPEPVKRTIVEHLGLVLRLEDAGLRSGTRRSNFVQAKHRATSFADSKAFCLFLEVASRFLRHGSSVSLTVQTRADREITEALHAALAKEFGEERIILYDPASYEDYLAAIGSADLLVTSRFHTVILGEAQGVPTVGVYSETHGHKMPGLSTVLGKPRTAVRLDDRLSALVADEVMEAAQIALACSTKVHARLESMRERTVVWLHRALRARARKRASAIELRLSALAALTRSGTSVTFDRESAELRRSVQRMIRLMEDK